MVTDTNSPRDGTSNVRGHLTEAAYEYMKERLLEGKYSPRERISPDSVMEAIGASRQPVMDAMRRLSVEGFVTVVPQVGCIVSIPEVSEIADFLRILASIEGMCASLAAQRASDQEILELQQLVEQFKQAVDSAADEETLAHEFRLHNRHFHGCLYKMAHSETVRAVAASLSDRADFYIANASGQVVFANRFADAVEEHRRVAEAVSWRDPEVACRVTTSHILAFIDPLIPPAP